MGRKILDVESGSWAVLKDIVDMAGRCEWKRSGFQSRSRLTETKAKRKGMTILVYPMKVIHLTLDTNKHAVVAALSNESFKLPFTPLVKQNHAAVHFSWLLFPQKSEQIPPNSFFTSV